MQESQCCAQHGNEYELLGHDANCNLNCLICSECFKGFNHQHTNDKINHQTISIQQLKRQLKDIENANKQQMKSCNMTITRYLSKLQQKIMQYVIKEKQRLLGIVKDIMFTSVSTDEYQLHLLEGLYNKKYFMKCSDIQCISSKLFNPTFQTNLGFKKLQLYVKAKEDALQSEIEAMMTSEHFKKCGFEHCKEDINYPKFMDDLAQKKKIQADKENVQKEEELHQLLSEKGEMSQRMGITENLVTPQSHKYPQEPKQLLNVNELQIKIEKPMEFVGSQLVSSREDTQFIKKAFNKKVVTCKLLYRASEHHFSVDRFHQLCDGMIDTIVFVRTEFNKVIGGFTPLPWKSTKNTLHVDNKRQSFIFSLNLKQKMPLIDEKSAIFNSANFGPTFGAGADLAICQNADTERTSYCEFPYSYANSRYKEVSQHSTTLFTGNPVGNHFIIKQWEVWQLHFQ